MLHVGRGGGRVLVPLRLVAIARNVSGLAAHVAGLGAVGAVAGDVAGFVAVVAGLTRVVAPALGAVPRDVPRLVAAVARRLVGALRALARYVPRAVTPVHTNTRSHLNISIQSHYYVCKRLRITCLHYRNTCY